MLICKPASKKYYNKPGMRSLRAFLTVDHNEKSFLSDIFHNLTGSRKEEIR